MKHLVTAAVAAALIAFAGSSLNVSAAPAGYYQDQKVVYHNDGGGPDASAYFKRMLNSIKNHMAAVGKDHVEIRVVDHATDVDLFQAAKTDKELADRLDALRADGVRFLVCANTLKERQIDWHQLYGVKEDDIVPSGVPSSPACRPWALFMFISKSRGGIEIGPPLRSCWMTRLLIELGCNRVSGTAQSSLKPWTGELRFLREVDQRAATCEKVVGQRRQINCQRKRSLGSGCLGDGNLPAPICPEDGTPLQMRESFRRP